MQINWRCLAQLRQTLARGRRIARLVEARLDNDPDDTAADGAITVRKVWRSEARRALGGTPQ